MTFNTFLILLLLLAIAYISLKFMMKRIIWWEAIAVFSICFLVAFLGESASILVESHDTEVWNSQVIQKKSERVSCSHSYSCNCTTDSKGNSRCQTCYEHLYDIDWNLYDNMNNVITIGRVNRQGTKEPPRWTIAKIGDPVATLHGYKNWVQAAKFSVFSEERGETKYEQYVPQYPQKIYNYHYLDRVLLVGKVPITDLRIWNLELSNILRSLGPKKEANIIIVFTDLPSDFYYSMMKIWKHGKKNDIIVIIGLELSGDINWVRVFSWSKKDIFNVKLRDEISELKTIDREKVIKTIYDITLSDFQRRSMKEFEYLKKEIQIGTSIWIMFTILAIGCWIGIDIAISRSNLTNTFQRRRRFR